MLIKEIVTRQEPILLELTYDPNLVKDVPNYRGVKFAWDKKVKLFKSAKTVEPSSNWPKSLGASL